jgi:hypothetical protein
MFLLDPKNKPQHMRALYGMHLLTHERIWFLVDPDIDWSLCSRIYRLAQTWANRQKRSHDIFSDPTLTGNNQINGIMMRQNIITLVICLIQHHETFYRRGRPVP